MEYSSKTEAAEDLMMMLCLNDTIDQLTVANSACWYGHVLRRFNGHVLRRKNGHVMRRTLDFEVEGQEAEKDMEEAG